MTSRKSNDWLEADSGDAADDAAYDSESREDSRVQRAFKRRKFSPVEEFDVLSDIDHPMNDDPGQNPETNIPNHHGDGTFGAVDKDKEASNEKSVQNSTKAQGRQKLKRTVTGVIYLSRVPPFMKPQTVKHLLEPYGEVGRIFLTPEDPSSHSRRVKSGGNKKRSFTDGWVEFKSKKDAKLAAETLNAQIIGGKKGGWYHDDLWNIKYLTGFKWHHLTEQIANENAERAARLRTEISQTTKENRRFMENVEMAKMLKGMEAKKQRQSAAIDNQEIVSSTPGVSSGKGRRPEQMHFKQNEVLGTKNKSGTSLETSQEVQRVLAKIF